jgi:hypothetical protein
LDADHPSTGVNIPRRFTEEDYSLFGLPAGESIDARIAAPAREVPTEEPGEAELSPAFAERLRWEDFRAAKPVARGGGAQPRGTRPSRLS